eukprot:scaffold2799_cov159-Ochromonas_danica.AAC.27
MQEGHHCSIACGKVLGVVLGRNGKTSNFQCGCAASVRSLHTALRQSPPLLGRELERCRCREELRGRVSKWFTRLLPKDYSFNIPFSIRKRL